MFKTRSLKKYFLNSIIFIFLNTNLEAQYSRVNDTLNKNSGLIGYTDHHYLALCKILIPSLFVIYGGLKPFLPVIQSADNKLMQQILANHKSFATNMDDYLMWVPSGSVYLMDLFHLQMKNRFEDQLIIDAGSVLVTGALGLAIRKATENVKAYHYYDFTQFPSGHAANAFRGAEIFHQELKYAHPVLSYSGYIIATTVGVLRIYNKAHVFSEVVTGAGIGILSAKFTYWAFDRFKESRRPAHSNGN